MTKRIFALLLALVMVFSMLVLAGCDKKDSDDEGEESSAPLTTKELFVASMVNTMSSGNFETVASMLKFDDFKANVKVELNKLVFDGTDLLDGSKASAELSGAIDLDNKAIELKADAQIFGEKPSASFIMNTEAIYAVDVIGLNKKPIKLTYEEMGIDVDEFLNEFGAVEAEMDKFTGLMESIADIITTAVEENFSDDSFEEETKTVTIEGTEFKDATVLTLVIDSEKLKSFFDDILTGLLENEAFIEITGSEEVDKEELLNDLDEFGYINIVNTIVDQKTVALDFELKALSDEAETEDYDEDGYVSAQRAGAHFGAKCTFVGDNFKIHVGVNPDENGEFDASQGIAKFERTVEGTDELIELYFDEDGNKEVLLKAEGTYEDGTHTGKLEAFIDGSDFSFNYEFEGDAVDCRLAISNFKGGSSYDSFELPAEIEIAYELGKSKAEMSVGVKLDYQGVQIDAVITISEEMTDVNIKVPTNAITVDELDMDEVAGWLEDAQKKYPKIFSYVEDLLSSGMGMGPSNESIYDDDYDYDYDYEYDYDYDYDF